MGVILLLMIGVPILEIAVFIEAGGLIGIWPTLGVVVLTAIAGTALLRHQGLSTLGRFRANLDAGRLPVAEVFDGLCLLVAGALLLTPGFVTDAVGLLLFAPPFRAALLQALTRRLIATGKVETWTQGTGGGAAESSNHGRGGPVIEGEYHEVPPEDSPTTTDDRNP